MSFSRYNLYFPEHRSFWWKKQFLKKARGHEVHLKCPHGFWPAGVQSWSRWPTCSKMNQHLICPYHDKDDDHHQQQHYQLDCNHHHLLLLIRYHIYLMAWAKVRLASFKSPQPGHDRRAEEKELLSSQSANPESYISTMASWRPKWNVSPSPLLQMPCSWLAGLVISCRGYLMPSYDQLHVEPKARFFLQEQKYIQDKLTRWTDLIVYLMDL